MTTTFETFIYRTIDGLEIECPIDCELELYKGSGDCDDPSEQNVLSAVISEDVTFEGITYFVKGYKLHLSDKERDDISEKYLILHKD